MHQALPRWALAVLLASVPAAAPAAPRVQQTPVPSFAAPGVESYQASGQILFQLGIMRPQLVNLAGSLVFKRGAPADSNGNSKRDVRTEVVALDLKGDMPGIGIIQVVARPDRASTGLLEAKGARTDYPATAVFDLILTVRTPYGPVIADQPLRVTGAIAKPAANVNLAMVGRTGVLLYYVTPGGPFAIGQITKISAKTLAEIPNPPPLGGLDCFPTTATLELDVFTEDGGTERDNVRLTGTTMVKRSDPRDSDGDGRWEIATEIFAMELAGASARLRDAPLVLGISPRADRATLGRIGPRANGQNFPAESFFDAFIELQTPTGPALINEEKLRLAAAGGIDSYPPGQRPFLLPLNADVQDPGSEVVGHATAVTLVFGELTRCPASLSEVAAGDDTLQTLATVELEMPELGFASAKLSGPVTIRRAPGGDPDGPTGAQPPRIGTEIVALNLSGLVTDDQGREQPVQIVIDRAANLPGARSVGVITQLRRDSPLPAGSFVDLIAEVRIGSGEDLRRYRMAAPVRLAGIVQGIPGRAPLCATSEFAPTGPVEVGLMSVDDGSEAGLLRWWCLMAR
jgi:hypothetical protein